MVLRILAVTPTTARAANAGNFAALAMLAAGCFVDQPGDGGPGGTTVMTSTTGEPGTGEPATGTSEVTSSSTGAAQTTSTGDPSTTGPDTQTTQTTTGSVCPPEDGFADAGTPECRACLSDNCCAEVSDCAAAPGCNDTWSCTVAEQCVNDWPSCPGHGEHQPRVNAISACRKASCADVCELGPCAAEEAVCLQNPACQAMSACVQANCSDPCPPEDPECVLPCWGACGEQNPQGIDDWQTLLFCYGDKCK